MISGRVPTIVTSFVRIFMFSILLVFSNPYNPVSKQVPIPQRRCFDIFINIAFVFAHSPGGFEKRPTSGLTWLSLMLKIEGKRKKKLHVYLKAVIFAY